METTFNFSNEQTEFLKSYRPKNDMFTSNEECELIISKFNLPKLSLLEMSLCRNAVVKFYSNLMKGNYDFMTSLQSVTAVIDYYSKGYTA